MGTITIKNLSTLTDKTVVLIVANYWHNAVSGTTRYRWSA